MLLAALTPFARGWLRDLHFWRHLCLTFLTHRMDIRPFRAPDPYPGQ